MICTWCQLYEATSEGTLPHLCAGCALNLKAKDLAHRLHVQVDEHTDDCSYCRSGNPCYLGRQLRIEADAQQIGLEYDRLFSPIDPIAWYIQTQGFGA